MADPELLEFEVDCPRCAEKAKVPVDSADRAAGLAETTCGNCGEFFSVEIANA